MYRRMLAWLLVFAMSISLVPTALAVEKEEKQQDVAVEADTYSIEGESSFGSILSDALNTYNTDSGNDSYAVKDLEGDTHPLIIYNLVLEEILWALAQNKIIRR